MPLVLLRVLVVLNVVTLALYGLDKLKARRGWWRIPESTLLLLALLGGSVGAWMGMLLFRHKTRHAKFRYGIPLILLLHLAIAVISFLKQT